MHLDKRPRIEDMFDKDELNDLYKLAFGEEVTTVNKKQFLELMRVLHLRAIPQKHQIDAAIGKPTKERFEKLFRDLKT
jgi:hypothetical protein